MTTFLTRQGVEVQGIRRRRACVLGREHAGVRGRDHGDLEGVGPWYVIPADHKHVMQAMVARILVETIRSLDLSWPEVSDEDRASTLRPAGSSRPSERAPSGRDVDIASDQLIGAAPRSLGLPSASRDVKAVTAALMVG